MASEEMTADRLYGNVSEQLGVPEEMVRAFAESEGIDPIEFLEGKKAVMEWKRNHPHRRLLVGRSATSASDLVLLGRVEA